MTKIEIETNTNLVCAQAYVKVKQVSIRDNEEFMRLFYEASNDMYWCRPIDYFFDYIDKHIESRMPIN